MAHSTTRGLLYTTPPTEGDEREADAESSVGERSPVAAEPGGSHGRAAADD